MWRRKGGLAAELSRSNLIMRFIRVASLVFNTWKNTHPDRKASSPWFRWTAVECWTAVVDSYGVLENWGGQMCCDYWTAVGQLWCGWWTTVVWFLDSCAGQLLCWTAVVWLLDSCVGQLLCWTAVVRLLDSCVGQFSTMCPSMLSLMVFKSSAYRFSRTKPPSPPSAWWL